MSGALGILGGAGGIGRVLVREAITAGYTPTIFDLPRSIEAHPPEDCEAIGVDASSAASLQAAAEKAFPDGGLQGFVNLCGFMGENEPVTETDPDRWSHIIEGNLNAAFLAAHTFVPRMQSGGALVHVGSGLGHFARPGYGPYAISKAGIAALTRQLALELAPDIRVNCVAPSAVDTAFLRGGTGRSDENEPVRIDLDAYASVIPLQRIADPLDVAGPILFLLSSASAYITGQVLHVNGGAFMP
ncbi:MAG: SDR family oxidoreductase [Pseudomonadota bacterium]